MPTGGKDWGDSLVKGGINGIAPGTLRGFLLDGGTKAAGKDIGTGSFSKAQYTKYIAWTRKKKGCGCKYIRNMYTYIERLKN